MATVNVEAARQHTTVSRGAWGEAFQQVIQGLCHIQEAVLHQEQRMEARLSEMEQVIREVTAQQERRLLQERQTTAATLAREEEARRTATSAFEDKLRRVEARMKALEKRFPSSGGQERGEAPEVEERLAHLQSRMERLEASTERALQSVLPRVDALLKHLETPSLSVASPHPTSTSTSADTSAPPPSSASASSPLRSPPPPPPPLTPERRKELGEQLIEASAQGRETDVRRLLDEGADVNFPNHLLSTPLMCAAGNAHVDVVSLLIRTGADVNAKNAQKYTALHLASVIDRTGRCATLLIRAGALVDSANDLGETALHLAAWADNDAVTQALLAAGASRSVRDNWRNAPSECAGTENIRRLLFF